MTQRIVNKIDGDSIDWLDPRILDVIDSDIDKARKKRDSMMKEYQLKGYNDSSYYIKTLGILANESNFTFNTDLYDIRESFIKMLNITHNDDNTTSNSNYIELEYLHLIYSSDVGRKGQRQEKKQLCSGILNSNTRRVFHQEYDRLIREVIAPHVISVSNYSSNVLYIQSFPCIRIVRPGEFSIGPHADIAYGFSPANINFYIPLTSLYDNNSIILESSPGLENWHSLDGLGYGDIKRFHGSMCTHFTLENMTNKTRVSLDFRVIIDELWEANFSQYSKDPGYYTKYIYSNNKWIRDTNNTGDDDFTTPDWRCGFPFSNK